MAYYKIKQDELLAFAKKIYEEACYGYMDLQESTCESLVNDFICNVLVDKTETETVNTLMTTESVYGYANYNNSIVYTSNSIPGDMSIIANGQDRAVWEVNTSQVRPEEHVRPEQNFNINES